MQQQKKQQQQQTNPNTQQQQTIQIQLQHQPISQQQQQQHLHQQLQQQHIGNNIIVLRGSRNENGQIVIQNKQDILRTKNLRLLNANNKNTPGNGNNNHKSHNSSRATLGGNKDAVATTATAKTTKMHLILADVQLKHEHSLITTPNTSQQSNVSLGKEFNHVHIQLKMWCEVPLSRDEMD
ncbi:hypothetical protein GQX74_005985 [Glossina fuscipes]|nr:hypothetical protein GQX74_005985 [Glossina fuscipes]